MYNYWCENRRNVSQCDLCDKKGDLKLDHKDETDANDICVNFKCAILNDDTPLKFMGETVHNKVGEKLKGRPQKEARKRSLDDFRKNIYPMISKSDKKHFEKKHGWKKSS